MLEDDDVMRQKQLLLAFHIDEEVGIGGVKVMQRDILQPIDCVQHRPLHHGGGEARMGEEDEDFFLLCHCAPVGCHSAVLVCQAGSLAVNSIFSAFITASVVLSVGLPLALKDR